MKRSELSKLLTEVKRGRLPIAQAVESLSRIDTADLGFARIDHQRQARRGVPEVVLAEGKTRRQVEKIVASFTSRKSPVLVTRLERETGEVLATKFPQGEFHELSRTFAILPARRKLRGGLLVTSGGTSDLPVAEEAVVTARALGYRAKTLYDVGVAGLGRLLEHQSVLRRAHVIIVVAGMEGALASVVAGMVSAPVIGVPTSAGYGVSMSGLAPLFGMLASCSGGLTVVNIDNGFGAACAASLILNAQKKSAR